MRPLYSDAGSGIIFNLVGDVRIGNERLPEGVIMLPINRRTEKIVLASGAQLSGIRFHPAVGYGVLGQHYDKPTLLSPEEDELYRLYQIYSELQRLTENEKRVEVLHLWAEKNLDFTKVIPDALEKALECVGQDDGLAHIGESTALSQRQIERIFKRWLGMSPKYFQRILRVKKAICFLRQNQNVKLADAAQQLGFCDQSHMTREFRTIACITPGQV